MKHFTNRRVIGILGMIFSLWFFLLGLYLFFLGEIIPLAGILIIFLAFLNFFLMLLLAIISFTRYNYIKDDIVSLISGSLICIIEFFMLFGLQVFLSLRNNYKTLPSFNLYLIAFGFNVILFVHSFLVYMSSRGHLIIEIYNQGNAKVIPATKHFGVKWGVVIPLILLIAVSGGVFYLFYPDLSGQTRLNVIENINVDFAGIDGAGYIENVDNTINYYGDNEKIKEFIQTIKLEYEDDNQLSNGDKVRVNVIYSRNKASRLKLFINRSYKYITVEGLAETYNNKSDLPDELIARLISDANVRVKTAYRKHPEYKLSLSTVYLAKTSKAQNKNVAIVIHQVLKNPKEEDKEKYKYEFRCTFHRAFDDQYLQEEDPYWYSHKLLKTSNDPCTTKEEAIESMKNKFGDYEYIQLQ